MFKLAPMKKTIFALICLITVSAFAQEKKIKESAITDAKLLVDAYKKQDVPELIRFTHPGVIKAVGGSKVMSDGLQQAFDKANADKMVIEKNETGKLLDFKKENGEYRCLIETNRVTLVSSMNKRFTQKSTLFGVYDDVLKHWTFIDGSKLTGTKWKYYFKEFETKINIPDMEFTQEDLK